MNKTCVCLGGYNVFINFDLKLKVQKAILQSIKAGYGIFLCNGFGNWSLFLASILREIQLNGYDILIECYIPCIFNAEQYKKELYALSYFDEVYVLPGKNLLETNLFLIKKGQRILMPKDEKIKNQTIMQTISRLAKEVIII